MYALLRPELPSSSHPENASYSEYRPGGSGCDPARLDRLKGRQSQIEGDRCAEAAEEYRFKSEDLEQQTRQSDADNAMVGLTYRQTVMMAAGTAIGFLTLVAAFFAVLYARRAGVEAWRAANAAEHQLAVASAASAAELRPYMFLERIEVDQGLFWTVAVKFKNYGKIPARSFKLQCDVYLSPRNARLRSDVLKAPKSFFPVAPHGTERTAYSYLEVSEEQLADFNAYRAVLIVRVRFWYRGSRSYAERADFFHSIESINDAKPYIITLSDWNRTVEEQPDIPDLLESDQGGQDG
jgi:hypothetical protein